MNDYRVTVLGSSPAWANPGGACSGYLLSAGGRHVLVECGFGILSRLRERLSLDDLDAVVISHLHADHFMDLVPLRYGLKYGRLRADARLPLYAPPDSRSFFAKLGRALDGDPHFFDNTYDLREYQPEQPTAIGGLRFEFSLVKHYIPSYAMAISNGRKLAYSADAAPCDRLVDLASEADLFLCEAAIESSADDDPNPELRGHMTAEEAAGIAVRARASRLLLTHYRATAAQQLDLATLRQGYGGAIEFAQEGHEYPV